MWRGSSFSVRFIICFLQAGFPTTNHFLPFFYQTCLFHFLRIFYLDLRQVWGPERNGTGGRGDALSLKMCPGPGAGPWAGPGAGARLRLDHPLESRGWGHSAPAGARSHKMCPWDRPGKRKHTKTLGVYINQERGSFGVPSSPIALLMAVVDRLSTGRRPLPPTPFQRQLRVPPRDPVTQVGLCRETVVNVGLPSFLKQTYLTDIILLRGKVRSNV